MTCNNSRFWTLEIDIASSARVSEFPPLAVTALHRCSCAAGCRHRFYKCMYVWINSSHCCMTDILLNVRQAKYLFSTIFIGTNSDCCVRNALCPKAVITWKFFSCVFSQWDQYHYLFQIQSDLFVRTPINRNPRYPKQIAKNRFLPTHFAPLIRKPHCPTPTWKFRNGCVILSYQ